VSDGIYENEPISDNDSAIDLDLVFGEDDGGDDAMDRSFSPPEKPRELDAFGTTVQEQREGESLDQRLAQEEPDPALALDRDDDDDGGDVVDDGEVGRDRAGRLVDLDDGAFGDTEKDLVAQDVGIDAGAASAEEAAVHVVEEQSWATDEGSSR
jgi:hypothetical protein